MLFSPDDLAAFWSAPWSVPLRSACRWLTPLCLQRWVGQAILARLAWMQEHPQAASYRYSGSSDECDPSIPCWTAKETVFYDWYSLRYLEERRILLTWEVEVERLLRTCEAPPHLVGQDAWA